MTQDEILKRCDQWFAAYMHDRENHDEAAELLAAIRNGPTDEPVAWLRRFDDGTYDVFHDQPRESDSGDARRWKVVPLYERPVAEPTVMQPIATAPTDGTPILGYSDSDFFEGPKTRFVVVHYTGEMQGWSMPGVGGLSITHWAPLPEWLTL